MGKKITHQAIRKEFIIIMLQKFPFYKDKTRLRLKKLYNIIIRIRDKNREK